MSAEALILIKAGSGSAIQVADAIDNKNLEAVTKVFVVSGPYDVAVLLKCPSIEEIGTVVIDELQTVVGVIQTLTMINLNGISHRRD
jgi:DNA-binding Lrp family transcriptional regulator